MLELVAFVLLVTEQQEIMIGAGPEWQDTIRLGEGTGVVLPPHDAGPDEIASYTEGGFLATGSSPVLLWFPSPDVQAVLAGQFHSPQPGPGQRPGPAAGVGVRCPPGGHRADRA